MDKKFKKTYSTKKDAVYDLVFAQLIDGDGMFFKLTHIQSLNFGVKNTKSRL